MLRALSTSAVQFRTKARGRHRARTHVPWLRSRSRPARDAEPAVASLIAEELPDRFGRLGEEVVRQLLSHLCHAAIEDRAIVDHLAAILAEQLRTHAQVAVVEHAEGCNGGCAGRAQRPGE